MSLALSANSIKCSNPHQQTLEWLLCASVSDVIALCDVVWRPDKAKPQPTIKTETREFGFISLLFIVHIVHYHWFPLWCCFFLFHIWAQYPIKVSCSSIHSRILPTNWDHSSQCWQRKKLIFGCLTANSTGPRCEFVMLCFQRLRWHKACGFPASLTPPVPAEISGSH